jgi:hypothetical protein
LPLRPIAANDRLGSDLRRSSPGRSRPLNLDVPILSQLPSAQLSLGDPLKPRQVVRFDAALGGGLLRK